MKTIIHVVGARPNFIKAAPLIAEIEKSWNVENLIIHTGQHYDHNMSQQFFDELNIPKPDYNLNAGGGGHAKQTADIMIGCEKIFQEKHPEIPIFTSDNKHPSAVGSYLAACVFYKILTGKSPLGLSRRFERKDEYGKKIFLMMVEKGVATKCQSIVEEMSIK